MNREELIKILHATETPDKIAKWLREQYFPEIMNRYNSEASRKRFGLYRNEQIPSNERNLTDVRTRMGVLIIKCNEIASMNWRKMKSLKML